jgi:hypothetical protein
MAQIPIFRALANPEGKVLFRETERERRHRWLKQIAGGEIEVIFRRPPVQRTRDQNAFIHAVPVPLVAERTGDSLEIAKRNLMRECFGYTRDLVTGLAKPWMEHTSSMTIEEATYFIEWVSPWAIDALDGLEIPTPGEVEFR